MPTHQVSISGLEETIHEGVNVALLRQRIQKYMYF